MSVAAEPRHPALFLPRPARIVNARPVSELEKFYEIELADGKPFDYRPGQFVEVSLFGIGEAPISITSSPSRRDGFELCVRRVGSVTRNLHALGPGDPVGIRGPFGNGFPMEAFERKDLLIVAGGIGIIPLRSVIKHVLANRDRYGLLTVLYGAKNPSELLFLDEMKTWEEQRDVQVLLTVDRAAPDWRGHVGVVTTLFKKIQTEPAKTVAVVVGPPVMFKFVVLELTMRGIPDQVIFASLERRMKCGLGKCGHCQINGQYVCKDGPVFTYQQLKHLSEGL